MIIMKKLLCIIFLFLCLPLLAQQNVSSVNTLYVAQKPWVDVTSSAYDQDHDGVCEAVDIAAAEAYADDAGGTLLFPPGTYTLNASITVSSNVNVEFMPGATLARAASETFTVYSPEHIIAGKRQTITTVDMLRFTTPGTVYPGWWGAVGDGATDCSSAFNIAGVLLGEVRIPSGTYRLNSSVTFTNTGLVGENSQNTTINFYGTGYAITFSGGNGTKLSGFTLYSQDTTQSGILISSGILLDVHQIYIRQFDTNGIKIGIAGTSGVYFSRFSEIYLNNTTQGTVGLTIDGNSIPNSNANVLSNVAVGGKWTTLVEIKGNNNTWFGGGLSWDASADGVDDVLKISGTGNKVDNVYCEAGSGNPTRLINLTSNSSRNNIIIHNQYAHNHDSWTVDEGFSNDVTTNGSIGYNYPGSGENYSTTNLIPNSNFKHWDGTKPFGWILDAATVTQESSTIHGSTYSIKLTGVASNPIVSAYIAGGTAITDIPVARLAGKTVSMSAWCKTDVASAGNIKIWADGTGGAGWGNDSHPGDDTWRLLTAIARIPSDATYVKVSIKGVSSGTVTGDVYMSEPILVEGIKIPHASPRSLDDSYSRMMGAFVLSPFITLADDATPSVLGGNNFVTGGTTTITDFDDGIEGQVITIVSEHAITITDGTNIFLNGSANFVMAATDTLTLIQKADGKWYELSRSDNT